MTFAVANAPSWSSFDSATGQLSGIPGADDVGSYSDIRISVSDGAASADLPPFMVTVTAPAMNMAPTISGVPAVTVEQGSNYLFQPSSSDADGDALSFSIANKPSWASFDTATGELKGAPGNGSAGDYRNIVISVSDGQASASLPAFTITVLAPPSNSPPTISGTPPATVTEGTPYSFTPGASDSDGDSLTFSVQNKPAWAAFETSTGRLSGTPALADVGSYSNIVIGVSDGQAGASLPPFSITVAAPPNSPPTITGTPSTSITAGTAYTFAPSASDADGDLLTFSIQNKPSWASFSSSTGQLSGTPGAADVGSYGNIRISVTDGAVSTSLASFTITVVALANGSATLSWQAPTQRTDGSPLTNLAGYKIYWGQQQGSYPDEAILDNPGVTTYVIDGLNSGTWYFVVTAFDTNGLESAYSPGANKTIP